MSLLALSGTNSASGGYDIENSCKFEVDNSESIVTTNQAAGNQKTWTWSGWLKRTELGIDATFFGAGGTYIRFVSGNTLNVQQSGTSLTTNQVFRDTSAWYHVVWILDTTQSTEADRSRIYINGSQITSFSAATYPSQNADLDVGGQGTSSNWLQLGRWYAGGRRYSGYIAEVHYLNGTVAEPTEFGEYDSDSGIWIPKEYTGGGYGTQGYYYKFDNASNLGEDSSGEGHDANSLNNITSADQATDTPTNNFATLNPLMNNVNGSYLGLSEGATLATQTANAYYAAFGSIGVSSGKWYWEAKVASGASNAFVTGIGIGYMDLQNTSLSHTTYMYDAVRYNRAGNLGNFGSPTTPSYGVGDIISMALDMDATPPTCIVYKNGTAYGNLMSGLSINGTGTAYLPPKEDFYFPYVTAYGARTIQFNFGGYTTMSISSAASDANGYGTFEYAPPSGYYALCTKNLAEYG